MRYYIITTLFWILSFKIASAQNDSLLIGNKKFNTYGDIFSLNLSHNEVTNPILKIDWLNVNREMIQSFNIKKRQIKKVELIDSSINVITNLMIRFNGEMITSRNEKKHKLSNIKLESIKSIAYLDPNESIKIYGREYKFGMLIIETN
ncbi:hypothetical protein [Pedobacter alpinus]